MRSDERIQRARAVEADKAWWEEWDRFHASPVDRTPEGAARHERLYAEFDEKLAAVKED